MMESLQVLSEYAQARKSIIDLFKGALSLWPETENKTTKDEIARQISDAERELK